VECGFRTSLSLLENYSFELADILYFRFMKIVAFLFVCTFAFGVFGQSVKLKKKFIKVYDGTLSAYSINLGEEIVKVNSEYLKVTLKKDSLFVLVGKVKYSGTYKVEKITKKEYKITGAMEETGIPALFFLDLKNKTLLRKGVFPQPEALLTIPD
jgi:hypothetical protein